MDRVHGGGRGVRSVRIVAIALATAVPAGVAAAEPDDAAVRYAIAAPRLLSRSVLEAPVPKMRKVEPASVSASACAACTRDAGPVGRALIPALPAGEGYELRVLKSAVNGFSLRLTDAEHASSPDERLRLRISRQKVSIAWQRSF
jgi:hypothetical protein